MSTTNTAINIRDPKTVRAVQGVQVEDGMLRLSDAARSLIHLGLRYRMEREATHRPVGQPVNRRRHVARSHGKASSQKPAAVPDGEPANS